MNIIFFYMYIILLFFFPIGCPGWGVALAQELAGLTLGPALVIPINTIQKLQRLTLKYSPSSVHEIRSTPTSKGEEQDHGMVSTCNWFFMNKKNTPKLPYASMKSSTAKEGCFSDDNCFICMLMGINVKEKGNGSTQETSSSTSFGSTEAEVLTRKRTRDYTRNGIRGSPMRLTSLDHWQPSLESIKEE